MWKILASVNSLSSSGSSSSIYGNRTYNIISGLASGLDTEQLISGVVQSYQQKIQSLQQDNTKLQWQQSAIQSISDKLVEFDRNYSSFVYSNTNLMSSSFFTNAVKTTASGDFAAMVTASGKSTSEVVLNAVKQLATSARYSVSGGALNKNAVVDSDTGNALVTGNVSVNLNEAKTLSTLAGSLTLNYGDRQVTIDFGDTELFANEDGTLDADAFRDAIVKKLKEQSISTSSGTTVAADTKIDVAVTADGKVTFSDKSGAGNTVSIAGATGSLASQIPDLDAVVDAESGTFQLSKTITKETNMADYLAGKSITVALDGKSKTIELPPLGSSDNANGDANSVFIKSLQEELNESFGSGKITAAFDKGGKLTFTVSSTSTLSISSEDEGVAETLGVDGGISSYLDTTKTLGDLKLDWSSLGDTVLGVGKANEKKDEDGNIYYEDNEGNLVNKDNQRIDEDGNLLYNLEINGKTIGAYSKSTELNTVINAISNSDAGVNVNYSKTTGQFVFTAKETGSGGRVEIESGGLAAALFGTIDPDSTDASANGYQAGVDAQFIATINGQTMEFTRASNSFDLDGMNVTVSGTFNKDLTVDGVKDQTTNQVVSFTSKTDSDTIVDAVKKMVTDLNALMQEVKSAYSDMPLQQSDGSRYEPLTDTDKEDMSDSAIEAYEEKAKTGVLFMDSDLSSLYNDLLNAITSSGADGETLRSIGLSTSYSNGLTTLTLDEQALRDALESDPDKVQQAFTKSKEYGASTDGLMASIKSVTDRYASTTGDVKGILIEKAGSKYSPTSALDNTLLNQMKDIEDEISTWQDKMSDKVDYYTNKFTQLEVLMNQMNSQSSALSGLMGG